MIRRLCKNSFLPKQASYRGDDIREGRFGFRIPFGTADFDAVMSRMLGEDQADDAEQAQQVGRSPQHRCFDMLARGFEAQMFPQFLKRGFDGPTGGEPTDDLGGFEIRVAALEVVVPMSAGQVMDKNPAYGNQSVPALIPLADLADESDPPLTAAIPSHRGRGSPATGCHTWR